ncbi:hypothetical protein CAOG_05174 [Capsaspora owczarzaki ATCC 30864]|uniref:Protein CASP n=1 Tax=Capsaspora owczarzaki (strain ATCC 30864) TaxID=595528 RepID=A0A0D2VTG4_CAPO3|nr:hypothetical protein CAOG_05174 [Capsaspora owczarzaki ATCC 30864]KJE94542.1 hypothetical protein CAOG_005174 [Capsaspora owczarzaki ATCC 30864]|eukprot:XP_004346859.1 hypothetical protein CAOG_05174 [Capsaspora owczarzaki ATCC 30864]
MSSPAPSPSPSPSLLTSHSSHTHMQTTHSATAATGTAAAALNHSGSAPLLATSSSSAASTPGPTNANPAAAVAAVAEFWSTVVALPQLQRELDASAQVIADAQVEGDASRKRLVEFTREFRKTLSEETKTLIKPIMTKYQTEIDTLSKRGKSAETFLANVYRKLADAPDPLPALRETLALQQRMQSVRDLEVENRKLRETMDEYHKEIADVKNQDVTITRLKERVKELEQGIDQSVKSKSKAAEQQMQEEFSERERAVQQQKIELATRLGQQEGLASGLKSQLEIAQSQLMDFRARHEEELHAKASEVELLLSDLDRANTKVAAAERQADLLAAQIEELSKSSASGGSVGAPGIGALPSSELQARLTQLDLELHSKEKEISLLVEELHKHQVATTKAKQLHAQELEALEAHIEDVTANTERLEHELELRSDYEDIKKELSILKMIESSNHQNNLNSEPGGVTSGDTSTIAGKSIETLLLEKNRLLQSELTQLKVNLNLRNEEFALLHQAQEDKSKLISGQLALIAQLESDLMNMSSDTTRDPSAGNPVLQRSASSTNHVSLLLEATNGNGSAPETPDASMLVGGPVGFAAASSSDASSAGLLPIVAGQRDRFRQRNTELEVENRTLLQQMASLRADIDALRSDNVKMYEKVKFLQSYPTKASATGNDAIERYSTQYEEQLNPFREFHAQERQRKVQALNATERITLSMGRFIMSNKYARSFVFFYSIILHALVFLVLYKLSWSQACQDESAALCVDRFAVHMREEHHGQRR